jgi:hypothetical protein
MYTVINVTDLMVNTLSLSSSLPNISAPVSMCQQRFHFNLRWRWMSIKNPFLISKIRAPQGGLLISWLFYNWNNVYFILHMYFSKKLSAQLVKCNHNLLFIWSKFLYMSALCKLYKLSASKDANLSLDYSIIRTMYISYFICIF